MCRISTSYLITDRHENPRVCLCTYLNILKNKVYGMNLTIPLSMNLIVSRKFFIFVPPFFCKVSCHLLYLQCNQLMFHIILLILLSVLLEFLVCHFRICSIVVVLFLIIMLFLIVFYLSLLLVLLFVCNTYHFEFPYLSPYLL